MVVFVDGKPRTGEYRKFKIQSVTGPDDFASMREIVERRYTRVLEEQGELPDLIVIDGGKGQLSSAVEILQKLGNHGLSSRDRARQGTPWKRCSFPGERTRAYREDLLRPPAPPAGEPRPGCTICDDVPTGGRARRTLGRPELDLIDGRREKAGKGASAKRSVRSRG